MRHRIIAVGLILGALLGGAAASAGAGGSASAAGHSPGTVYYHG
jgi:hypothetical protein